MELLFLEICIYGYLQRKVRRLSIKLIIKKDFFFAVMLIGLLLLIYTFRSYSVGTDTLKYIENFQNYKTYNTPNVLYKWLVYTINLFSHNPRFFLLVLGSLLLIPIFISINKYSPLSVLSVLIFAGFFYGFSLNIARQFIVMSFFYFIGINLIQNRKLFWFIFLIAILSLIHMVSLIYLPFYFFIHKSLKLRTYLIIWISSIILYSIKIHSLYFVFFEFVGKSIRLIFPQMPSYLLNPGNLIINSISINRLILYNILILPILFFYKKIADYPYGKIFFNLFFWGVVMQNLFYHFIPFLRVPMCFYIAIIYLYPIIINDYKYRFVYSSLIVLLSIAIFYIMFILGGQAGIF